MSFDLTNIISILIVILASMILHELMHGLTAYWLGDDTAKLQGRLTLNPLAHIDPFSTILLPVLLYLIGQPPFGAAKPVPFNPDRVRGGEFGAALIGIAGPLTNLVLAFISYGLLVLFLGNPTIAAFLKIAVSVNLSFFAFNILPIPPLDGSRVVYALAPDFVRRGMEAMERYGIYIIFGLVIIANGLFSTIVLEISNVFIEIFMHIYGR